MDNALLAQEELNRRVHQERCRYYTPCGRSEQFLNFLKDVLPNDPGIKILILRAGNRFGKSALATNLAGYLGKGLPNPWFDKIPYLKEFRRPNRGRVFTTGNAAATTYQDEITKWFPKGSYKPHKDGKTFYKRIRFNCHSQFDFFTFDQDWEQAESIGLDWAIIDEPPPHKLWGSIKTRFTKGGLIIFVLTPLEDAAWMADELEIPDRLGDDVFALQADTEDACIEHGVRGHLHHASIVAMMKDFDEAELAARKGGSYLHLSGRIYKTYRAMDIPQGHCPVEIPEYHQDNWSRGNFTLWNVMDPHDRKPFAIGWYIFFPNGDDFTIAEWPDEDWPPFRKMKDCSYLPKDYAKMIKMTEETIGKRADRRLIDPNFGNTPCFATHTTIKQDMAREGTAINYPLIYQDPPDSLEGGHIKVKSRLGDPAQGIRPKSYDLAHCKNHIFGMTRYGWKDAPKDETKGDPEKPQLQHKDFPDLRRYLALAGGCYIPVMQEQVLHKRSNYGKPGYRGA